MAKELTVVAATRRLGITIDALYRLIYAGKLPARKAGRRWLISASAVEERLKAREERDSKCAY
jgi:excisionase family DNA binding protein